MHLQPAAPSLAHTLYGPLRSFVRGRLLIPSACSDLSLSLAAGMSYPWLSIAPSKPRDQTRGNERRAVRRRFATRTSALPWLLNSEGRHPLIRRPALHLVGTAAGRASVSNVLPGTSRHLCGPTPANEGCSLRLIPD